MAKPEPTFTSCFVDQDLTRRTITIGDTTFKQRGVTAGEHEQISAESISKRINVIPEADLLEAYASAVDKTVDALTDDERRAATSYRLSDRTDINKLMILTVAASLGAYHQFGDEGWSAHRPVTIENVRMLRKEIIEKLFEGHQDSFRGEPGDAAEPGEGDPVDVPEADRELVSSERRSDG